MLMIAQETPPRTPRARATRTAAPRPLVPASRGWKRFAGHLILLVMGGRSALPWASSSAFRRTAAATTSRPRKVPTQRSTRTEMPP